MYNKQNCQLSVVLTCTYADINTPNFETELPVFVVGQQRLKNRRQTFYALHLGLTHT